MHWLEDVHTAAVQIVSIVVRAWLAMLHAGGMIITVACPDWAQLVEKIYLPMCIEAIAILVQFAVPLSTFVESGKDGRC